MDNPANCDIGPQHVHSAPEYIAPIAATFKRIVPVSGFTKPFMGPASDLEGDMQG